MTRIAVISDSHNRKEYIEAFIRLASEEHFDYIFHLGDYTEDAQRIRDRLNTPVSAVCGNCDLYSFYQEEKEKRLTIEGKRILLTHGHRHGVKWGDTALSYYAEERGSISRSTGTRIAPAPTRWAGCC